MSKEFKIGLIAIVAGAVLYYGFNYLRGIDFFTSQIKYYVVYNNVGGLARSNPVMINGFSVGKVSDIELLQEEKNKVLVELTIDEEVKLGDSTIAELTTDLLGGKSVVLNVGAITRILEPRDTLIAYVDRGIEEYLDSVEPITSSLNVTVSRINEILLGLKGSGEKINNTLGELEVTTREVNDIIRANKGEMTETLILVKNTIDNLNNRISQLDPILSSANTLLDSLNQVDVNGTLNTVNNLLYKIDDLLADLDNGQGTVGKLMTNDSLYNNLNQLLIDLDKTMIHFNQYPRDFLKPLGRKHEKLKGTDPSNQ
ncbi:MAG: MCE family protein [Cyclobacteriaceae bacterium]